MAAPQGNDREDADPALVLAAEAGDTRAMLKLAWWTTDPEQARRWIFAAAESGDPEGMYRLGEVCAVSGNASEAARWHREAAAAGHDDAMFTLAVRGDTPEERAAWAARCVESGGPQSMYSLGTELRRLGRPGEAEQWIRAAAEAGHRTAAYDLARTLKAQDRLEDAEHWYRAAAEAGHSTAAYDLACTLRDQDRLEEAEHWLQVAADGGVWRAAADVADLLAHQGRVQEAERWYRQEAEKSWSAAGRYADFLDAQGRYEEAGTWRRRAEEQEQAHFADMSPGYGWAPNFETVAMTALVTTAVVPFIQALAAKVAEDAYGEARGLLRRLLRRGTDEHEPEAASWPVSGHQGQAQLVIANDPEAGIDLYLWSDASDDVLQALATLNLDELKARRPDQGRVRLVWHQASGQWCVRGEPG